MKIRSKNSWWDIALYLGVFLLVIVFLYQLLKLWQAGVATIGNIPSALSQAFSNTVAAVEAGLAAAVTSPLGFLSSLFAYFPDFLSLALNFLGSLSFGSILPTIAGLITSLFGIFSTPSSATTSTGSSTAPTTAPTSTPSSGNSLGTADFSAQAQ